jgi:hypothetical protein
MVGKIQIGTYVVLRTYSAGVHFGVLIERDGQEATLSEARRLHRWEGGRLSLHEIATEGPPESMGTRVSVQVDTVTLTQVIEVISASTKGEIKLRGFPAWKP